MDLEKEIRQQLLTGERALFQAKNRSIYDSVFADGESPLRKAAILHYMEVCLNGNILYGTVKGFP